MGRLYVMLSKIRERPGLYIGTPSLELLIPFINGYLTCNNDINSDNVLNFYEGFEEFLVDKFEIKISTSFYKIISFISINDQQAFDMFFELLDEFIDRKKENIS